MFPLTCHLLNHKAESMELHDSEVHEVLEFYIDLENIQKIFSRMLDRIRLYMSNKIKKKFTNERNDIRNFVNYRYLPAILPNPYL